ncbi:MAG: hypothetical protein J7M18_07720 [Candidatus Eremiobacteraeota bacterium]|nr:hypothetical protein [Candidatus Eremiobacteraeota bacterium]
MKRVFLIFLGIIICLHVSTALLFGAKLSDYSLATIPVPGYLKEVSQKADITMNKIYPLISDIRNSGLISADPFYFDRRARKVPKYDFRLFETTEHPRKIFLFYKNFANGLRGGYACSDFHYDVENEGDRVTSYKDTVFYRININSSGKHFDIVAVKPDKTSKTIVYIFSYTKR